MQLNLEGKAVIVTGAASGIGRETALAFAREGAQVLIADISAAGAETADAVRAAGAKKAAFLKTDVSSAADVRAMVALAVAEFGGVDVAVNNAGIDPETAPVAEWDEATFAKVMAVNLQSVFLCMKYAIEPMLARGGGAIVNVASLAGLVGVVNKPAYTASKHGIVGLTRASALQYGAQRIRVNAVCPAAVDTPILERNLASPDYRSAVDAAHPIGRMGQPHDVASAILWLASDAAGFVTGHALAVDGGLAVQ